MDEMTEKRRQLRRAIAKIVHPDLARTPEEHARFTKVMSEANAAYSDGSMVRLESIFVELTQTRTQAPPPPPPGAENSAGGAAKPRKKPRQKGAGGSSPRTRKPARTRTLEQAQKKADAIVEKCFVELPDRDASYAFLEAVRDFMYHAVAEENFSQIDDFALGVDDMLARWFRIMNGPGKKLARVYSKTASFLPKRGSLSHTPESIELCMFAASAFFAMNLSLLQSVQFKAQAYYEKIERKEYTPDPAIQRREEATQAFFDLFPDNESRIQKAEALASQSPFVAMSNKAGDSLLHAAIRAGCPPEVVTVLMFAGSDVNEYTRFGETALHIALAKGDINLVIALLEEGANPGLETSDYITTQMQMETLLTKIEQIKTRLGMTTSAGASARRAGRQSNQTTGEKP